MEPFAEQRRPSEYAQARRSACTPTAGGCGRCQLTWPDAHEAQPTLLLGLPDSNAAALLRRALDLGRIHFTAQDLLIRIPDAPRDLGALRLVLREGLSEFALSRIRAAYVSAEEGAGADRALSAALFAAPLLEVLARAEHEWVRAMLAQDGLFSVFHPILDAHTGKLFAQEALMRGRASGIEGVVGAGRIIQACEQLQLEHVLDQKARQAAIRGAAQHVPEGAHVFINFLPNTIYDPAICLRTTMETAAECEVPLSRLVLEVVETESIPDMRRLKRILDYYRERGVGTAVDDMGAGFTNHGYITELRPDFVKLDRALIVAAETGSRALAQVEALIRAARRVGSRVIAEGIETATQLEMCQAVGVDYVQGFLFAMPQCPPATARWTGAPAA